MIPEHRTPQYVGTIDGIEHPELGLFRQLDNAVRAACDEVRRRPELYSPTARVSFATVWNQR